MFFLIVMRWIQFLYDRVFYPVITTPYFYMMIAVWLWFALGLTYLFFYWVDPARIKYMTKKVAVEMIRSTLLSLLIVSAIIGLYDLALYLTATSEFFRTVKPAVSQFGAFGASSCCGSGIQGQSWDVLQYLISILFFIAAPFFVTHGVSAIAYHLQDGKIWWRYCLAMGLASGSCFLFFRLFGFI